MSGFQSLSRSLTLSTLALMLSAALGCSNSSSGGGGVPAPKPNLTPATEVGQSFATIKSAGDTKKSAGGSQDKALILERVSGSVAPPVDRKDRSEKLKKMLSQPDQCKVDFKAFPSQENIRPGESSGNPSTEANFGFELTIGVDQLGGGKCPITASFKQSMSYSMSGSGTVELDFSFQVTDEEAKKLVNATDAKISGQAAFGPSADGSSFTGKGQFAGFVNSIQYGRVDIETKMNMDIRGSENAGPTGTTLEEAIFKFPDASLNATFAKLTTYNKGQAQVLYTANGAAITEQEYNDAVGTFGSAPKMESGQQPGPENPQQ